MILENELMKCYPKIRIPYMKGYRYYLEQLGKTMDLSCIQHLEDCVKEHGDVGSYKMRKLDEILKYFKEDTDYMRSFNDAPLEEYKSSYSKQFNDWKLDRMYLSLDVNEANWAIFKHTIGLQTKEWEKFSEDKFDLHPFLSRSKSYRQLVFGNLNPSRQQVFQKRYMGRVADAIFEHSPLLKDDIVMLSADEILFEMYPDLDYISQRFEAEQLVEKKLPLKMKIKLYTVSREESYGDSVLVKTYDGTNNKELFGANGNRFFIHYKKLILNEEINELDLYFEPEPKKLARWIL